MSTRSSYRSARRSPASIQGRRRSCFSLDNLESRTLLSLTFVSPPGTVVTGQVMAPIKVQSSNHAAGIPITISLSEQSTVGTPILSGTVTQATDASGTATFSDLYIYGGTGANCVLTATSAPATAGAPLDLIVSPAFQVNPGDDHLYVSSTIPTTIAGSTLGTITVQDLDINGNVVTGDSTTTVQLYISTNPGRGKLLNATSQQPITTPITATMIKGVATFSGVALDKAGIGYLLGVQGVNNTTLIPGTSNAFVITAGAPAALGFLVQPTFTDPNVVGNSGQTYTINEYNPNTGLPNAWNGVVADVVDKFGNQVTNGITAGQITMSAVPVGGSQAVPFDTTNGHTAVTQVNIDPKSSVAVFSQLLWTRERGQTANYNSKSFEISNLQDPIGIQALLKLGPVGVAGPGIPEGDYVQSVDVANKKLVLAPYQTTGSATNGTIFVNSAGNFTLKATVTQPLVYNGSTVQTVVSATSNPFIVSVGRRAGLKFVGAPPTSLQVGAPIPTIQIAVVDLWGNTITTDNTDSIVLTTGSIKGTKTVQVVNGIATFSDLSLANIGGLPQSGAPLTLELKFVWQNQALPLIATTVSLAAGQPYALKIVNPLVAGKANSEIKPGSFIRASATQGGAESPIEVEVVDSAGNLVTSDNSTIVSIGFLATNGRGAVFVGNSKTKYTAKDPRKIAPLKNLPAVPNSWDFEATGQVKNGVVHFPDLYANFPGKGYILAAGTTNFASQAGATTEPFEIGASQARFKRARAVQKTEKAIHARKVGDLAKTNTVLAGASPIHPAAHALLRQPKKSSAKQLPQGHTNDQVQPKGIIKYGLGSLTTNFDTISNLKSYQKFPPGGRPYPPVVGFDPATVPAAGPALQQPNVAKGFTQVPQSSKWWTSLMFPRSYVAKNPGSKNAEREVPQDSQKHQLFALNAEPITAMVNSNQTFEIKGNTTEGTNKIELGKSLDNFRGLTLGLTVKANGVFSPNTTITEIDAKTGQIKVSSKAMKGGEHTLTFNDFAGLGMSYLSSSANFFVPSVKFLDPGGDHRPAGQPEVWDNPQAPGNQNWQYLYGGNGNARNYQDLSVGLQGVQADGKVLAYSDWTTTIDWQGTDSAGRAQELQATLGQGLPFAYFTVPTSTDSNGTTIQLVTSPKTTLGPHGNPHPVNVTVTAYDATGKAVTSGTGAFELEISYTLHDGLDTRFQQSSSTGKQREKNILTVADATQLSAGMSVSGDKIKPETTILKVIDSTHVEISKTPEEIKDEVLTFNALAQRHFDNFYGVYLPTGIAWQLSNKDTSGDATLTATLSSKNYFSVATLPGGTPGAFNPAFTTFLPHAYTFVTGSSSSFNYNQSTGNVATTFALQSKVMQATAGTTDTGPLQTLNAPQYNNLLPGDLQALKGFNVNGKYNYVSPQGELLLWDGPIFDTQLTYTGILPSVPPLPNAGAQIPGIPGTGDAALWKNYLLPILRTVSTLEQSDGALVLDKLFPNDNNYLQAQSMYGASQLVPILLEISQSMDPGLSAADKAQAATYAQLVYNAVKNRMGSWLSANDDDALQMLYYQPKNLMEHNAPAGSQGWQSLMSILSGFLSSETLNDHQLIAGYFIKVAAFLAQYDNTWGQSTEAVSGGSTYLQGKLGDVVNLIVSDVSNYNRSSTSFPFMRNFDDWDMHSWADGAANSDVGTNLESSSEAMNYDSALIQWGAATGNQAMRDLGVYMYTSELQGVQTYWFSMKNQTDPFGRPTNVIPAQYLGSAANGTQRTIVTKLNNNGGSYVGFIGLQTSRVAGIQFLPYSGSAYYLGQSPSFVATTYALAQKGASAAGTIPLVPPTYQSLLLPYLALSDPKAAFTQYTQNINQISLVNPGDYIDNNAFNLHWIEVLQAYGQVDPTVTANTVFYTVFNNAGVRTFVAYNPTATPLPVQFKDSSGNVLLSETVAPFATLVSKGSGNTPQTLAQQTNPNYSLATPQNRLFFTTNNGNPTLTYGQTGTGENAIVFTGQPLTFTMTGLTGTFLGQDAATAFSMWFDPETRTPQQNSPGLQVTVTYDPDGTGQKTFTQTFSQFNMGQDAGYVEYRSQQAGGVIATGAAGVVSPPLKLTNGSVTVTIKAVSNISDTAPVRFRTDAAAQQGRVSYIDLPYAFTTVGSSGGNPVPVRNLNLGGQTLGPALPNLNG